MLYRRLGPTGLPVSVLALGTWLSFADGIERGTARALVATAWDAGINLFDSAENYAQGRAETVLGDVIADLRLPRDGYALVSKALHGAAAEPLPMQRGLTRKHLRDACEASLRRLRTDYLDLFLCHRPDPDVPLAETIHAMDLLVRQGKVLHWGTSEWPGALIAQARRIAAEQGLQGPVLEQAGYSLLRRERVEREYPPLLAEAGMGLMTFSPLASGLLSGKYAEAGEVDGRLRRADLAWLREREMTAQRARQVEAFVRLAEASGAAPAALAIAWCLRNPAVSSVILGATGIAQLQCNLGALALPERLDDAVWQQVEATFT